PSELITAVAKSCRTGLFELITTTRQRNRYCVTASTYGFCRIMLAEWRRHRCYIFLSCCRAADDRSRADWLRPACSHLCASECFQSDSSPFPRASYVVVQTRKHLLTLLPRRDRRC